MASSAALRTAAVLMLVLFAGQLLVATPAAAAARRSLLQVPADTTVCGINNNICDVICFKGCITFCNGKIADQAALLLCREDCVGKCEIKRN
ncbi:hypothetical protein SEVIR_2G209750v4 [Setaria viridis]|uniref:Knottin scorpion toxin-like domain-containing protein n=1 Tax=Setaria viridis TaxID=4556 RepID=A0A4V6DBC4_SETVI|nr:hypothetical protein SEVIR_2G209750v2 [Setaria viridis]